MYRLLTNEAFEEFRHWSYQVRTLRHLCPESDDGTVCPACPQVRKDLTFPALVTPNKT